MPTHYVGATPTLQFTWVQEDGTTALDISGASPLVVRAQRPDGTTVDWALTPTNDGTDGRADYVVQSTDFNIPGAWHFQGVATIGTRDWFSDEHHRDIRAPLPTP